MLLAWFSPGMTEERKENFIGMVGSAAEMLTDCLLITSHSRCSLSFSAVTKLTFIRWLYECFRLETLLNATHALRGAPACDVMASVKRRKEFQRIPLDRGSHW